MTWQPEDPDKWRGMDKHALGQEGLAHLGRLFDALRALQEKKHGPVGVPLHVGPLDEKYLALARYVSTMESGFKNPQRVPLASLKKGVACARDVADLIEGEVRRAG